MTNYDLVDIVIAVKHLIIHLTNASLLITFKSVKKFSQFLMSIFFKLIFNIIFFNVKISLLINAFICKLLIINTYLIKQAIALLFLNVFKIQNLINTCFILNSNESFKSHILIKFNLNFILNQ